jgi:FAD/FMN-containing dehydrogenase
MLEKTQEDWIVPVDLGIGSKAGIATILGYIATNAAGSGAAFKGRAIDMVKSLRVMYVNGNIDVNPNSIDIIGMGGTTGIIVEATINLLARPKLRSVAALRVENIGEMYAILEAAKRQCWEEMNLFERMNERLFDVVAGAINRADSPETAQLKAARTGDLLFIEVNAEKSVLEKLLAGREAIITDDVNYADWLLEYRVVNASTKGSEFAKNSGGKMVAFDISVPAGDVDEFPSKELIAEIEAKFAGINIFAFGHAAGVEKISADTPKGGTALHFNPVLPRELATSANIEWLRDVVFSEVSARGGQIVSEHGIGTKFVAEFKKFQPDEYAATAATIARHDPQNILNRGAYCAAADVQRLVIARSTNNP